MADTKSRLFLEKLSTILDGLIVAGSLAVCIFWLAGKPILYTDSAPVMSIFTGFSLLCMAAARLARRHLYGWPTALTLAVVGLVLGGNLSSILIHTTMPRELMLSFGIVLTSVLTSIGLVLFCIYELLITLRETPKSAFILDDILIHLAIVPGGLNLLGIMLNNPAYLSEGADPRIGVSILEMIFMGIYAVSAVISNPNLFLWQFLKESWANRLVFLILFANQFIAPVIVAYVFLVKEQLTIQNPGLELFVLLAGVIATVSFLSLQAFIRKGKDAQA